MNLARAGVAALALLTVGLLPGLAPGQQVKPYVMLLFDTSGSMRWDICHNDYGHIAGDNSNECPGSQISCSHCNTFGCGNGLHDDARIYKVKKGAYNVVSVFGEVTFGLSRFHMTPRSFVCGTNWRDHGGWRGAPSSSGGCSGDAVGTGWNTADVLVSFADNNQDTILRWMNNCDDYPTPGACPWNSNPGSGTPGSGCNLCSSCGGGCDMELRAGGMTPLAGSLRTLYNRFHGASGVISGDSKSACRPYKVILLTDGQNACPGNPNTEAAALYNLAAKSIPVHVVGFGAASLKPGLDAIAAAGGTTSAIIVDNEVSLALAMANIISESLLKETCNNADDDCNGQCDESWPEVAVTGAPCTNKHAAQTCSAGIGICLRTGVYVCKSDGTGSQCSVTAGPPNSGGEICNNSLDDDCDGAVDEGCVPCVPQPEICNGKDDDCDLAIDEGYVSVACGSSIGECQQGTTACVGGAVVCSGASPPSTELCDNKDNNCDTIVDKFSQVCYPPATGCNASSGVCQGVCQVGSRLCSNGTWGGCLGYKGPTTEACNGIDDDCDGQTDEGVSNTCTNYATCASYITCSACQATPAEICDGVDNDCNGTVDDNALLVGTACGVGVGECLKGKWACVSGGLVCQGGTGPATEICDGKDNDCDGKIDDGITGLGGTCGTSVGECKPGTYQCIGSKVVCAGGVKATTEVCDGKDNDCDGQTDEGIPSLKCGSDVGECTQGTTACVGGKVTCSGAKGPTAELCNGLDDDCDGVLDDSPTDEGKACGSAVGQCAQGVTKCINKKLVCTGAAGAKTEICDGLDNDCNGTVDDKIAGAGTTCGTNVGECKAGSLACLKVTGTGWTMTCVGSVGSLGEICDGKDNDCDGQTDETFPQQGQTCGTNIGECKAGAYVCELGKVVCKGSVGSTAEICDGLDNDCNGAIDDKVPGEGAACGSSVGECKPGKKKCVGGKMICVGGTGATKEICDGKDNDCDGQTDEAAECPGASKCVEGKCLVPCKPGEFVCPGGTKCKNGYCFPDKCSSVTCKETERCVDGACVSKCSGVVCESHETCDGKTGQCVDDSCVSKGCTGNKVCVGYKCVDDPCPAGKCPQGQICSEGKCYDTCANVTCPAGQTCVLGSCTSDPCAKYKCEATHTCELVGGKPQCVPDPCRLVTCVKGQVCHQGKCVSDPCASTACPEGFKCVVTNDGRGDCEEIPGYPIPTTSQMLATGAGGCACQLPGSSGGGAGGALFPLLLAALLGLFRALRRRRS